MSIVNSIEVIKDWLTENVCQLVKLKLPDDNATDASYPYKLVNPAAFALFVPTKDRMPPKVAAPIPSVCVQLVSGSDDTIKSSRGTKIRLLFSAWDPGYHGPDIFKPKGNDAYIQQYNEEATTAFEKNSEGWRDAWNFVDIALRAVESVTNIGGCVIDRNTPIMFGPLTEQESIPDLYPFWFAWISFRVKYPLMRNIEEVQKYL